MKKNLLYLLALVCSITFFAACSSDDDDSKKNEGNEPEEEVVVTAPDVVGTYWGNLNISMIADGSDQENVIADGVPKFITFSQVSDTEIKIELKDFELFMNGKIMKFGSARNPPYSHSRFLNFLSPLLSAVILDFHFFHQNSGFFPPPNPERTPAFQSVS